MNATAAATPDEEPDVNDILFTLESMTVAQAAQVRRNLAIVKEFGPWKSPRQLEDEKRCPRHHWVQRDACPYGCNP